MAKSVIQEKSFDFALEVIEFYKKLQAEHEHVLSKKLLRNGMDTGANVEEAIAGQSRKDSLSKMAVASREARGTRYRFSLLRKSSLTKIELNPAIKNSEELLGILTSVAKTKAESWANQNSKLKTQN